MTLLKRTTHVIPIRSARSEGRDLVKGSRIEDLRTRIVEGRFVIDLDCIASGVIIDLVLESRI